MTPERWRQIREILDGVFALPPGEREGFLDRAAIEPSLRLEVDSLIRAHEAAGTFIDRAVARLDGPADAESASSRAGTEPGGQPEQIGGFRILRSLGRGGMGSVYLARRSDGAYRQQVAVKVLRWGMASEEMVRRFRSERQILASLEHPSIAKLLDGGTTADGLPYLVMDTSTASPSTATAASTVWRSKNDCGCRSRSAGPSISRIRTWWSTGTSSPAIF